MKILRFLIVLGLNLVLIYALNTRWGIVPPLGKFLDPFSGFWQNAETANSYQSTQLALEGLKSKANIVYDSLLIPHIFAENDEDVYFLQGYVTAQHRLWQMEFQTYLAAGRISEIVGDRALDFDRETRRRGMIWGAKKALEAMQKDEQTLKMVDSYTKGVNAYIKSLNYQTYPVEYKLLDYAPEEWTSLKTALLLKYMASTLASGSADIEFTNALKLFGENYFDILYPDMHPEQDPIVNAPQSWNFTTVSTNTPDVAFLENTPLPAIQTTEEGVGSNNWAISSAKSANGNAILCDDPHLEMNLPSIWYVMQLSSPTVNVFGATLPGATSVIVGFNDSISWGVTNAQRDVVDWYKVEFKNASQSEYLLDGNWQKTTKEIEEIKVRGRSNFYDTIYYTHWGPITYDRNFQPVGKTEYTGLAMRWVAHDPSEEALAFHKLNRGTNYNDFVSAISYFSCPAQNFVFASYKGDVAIWVQGKYPIKTKNQGKFVLDGTKSENAWKGFIPQKQNVHAYNPARGFVSSANQNPVDSTYPYPVFADHYEYYRNRRINKVLDSLKNITPKDMMNLQNDNFNLQAAESLPYFLSLLDQNKFGKVEKDMYQSLISWNLYNEQATIAASYYEIWWSILKKNLWDEMEQRGMALRKPENFTSIKILKKRPDFAYIDIISTPQKETVADLLNITFKMTADSVRKWQDQNPDKNLQWANVKASSAVHLTRSKAFSVYNIQNGGNRGIVNATSSRHSPSWRMIAEMDKKGVKAWGVYPGGQSGNPGSPYYTNLIDYWTKGQYYSLWYMRSATEQPNKVLFQQTLQPK